MPRINVGVLVKMLRSHVARLHEIYVDCKDIQICDRLMQQIIHIECIIAEMSAIV